MTERERVLKSWVKIGGDRLGNGVLKKVHAGKRAAVAWSQGSQETVSKGSGGEGDEEEKQK